MKLMRVWPCLLLGCFIVKWGGPAPIRHTVKLNALTQLDGPTLIDNIQKFDYTPVEIDPEQNLQSRLLKGPLHFDQNQPSNQQSQNLWDNTVMVLGANADVVGIGSGFLFSKQNDDSAIFVTALHVLEPFCKISQDLNKQRVEFDDGTISCETLFVLHDVLVNAKTNDVENDGPLPWKAPVATLFYYDRILDVATLKIKIPPQSGLNQNVFDWNYNLEKPFFVKKDAVFADGSKEWAWKMFNGDKNKPQNLVDFEIDLVGYPVADVVFGTNQLANPELIKKRRFTGRYFETKSYENEKKLGFFKALHHSIRAIPGTSGAAISLSDGRIIGINSGVLVTEFFTGEGCTQKLVSVEENYAVGLPSVNEVNQIVGR